MIKITDLANTTWLVASDKIVALHQTDTKNTIHLADKTIIETDTAEYQHVLDELHGSTGLDGKLHKDNQVTSKQWYVINKYLENLKDDDARDTFSEKFKFRICETMNKKDASKVIAFIHKH